MSQPHDPIQQASNRYHAHYSDVSYKAIQRAVVADRYEPAETPGWDESLDQRLSAPIPNRLMNLITDAASEICQWPGFENSLLRLAQELVLQRVCWTTVELIIEYLHRFEAPWETFSADFCAGIQTTRFILKAQPVLQEATSSASDIHASKGRAAYHLLVAAEQLTRSAQLLLSGEDNLFYILEKVTHATDHIASALEEQPLKRSR